MDYSKLIPIYAGKADIIAISLYLLLAFFRGKTKGSAVFTLFFAVPAVAILYSKFSLFLKLLWEKGPISIEIEYAGTIEIIYLVAGIGASAYFASNRILNVFIDLFEKPTNQLEEEVHSKRALLVLLHDLKTDQTISEADYELYKLTVAPELKKLKTPWETLLRLTQGVGGYFKKQTFG